MDIYKELADLLNKCSDTPDYYNPWLLQDLINWVEEHDTALLKKSIYKWVHKMWER